RRAPVVRAGVSRARDEHARPRGERGPSVLVQAPQEPTPPRVVDQAARDQSRLPAAPELPRMSTRPLPLLAVLAGGLALGPRPAVAAPTTDETVAAPTTDETVAASERELQAGLAA